jgi:mannosyltransferase
VGAIPLALGLVLGFVGISERSIWMDEAATLLGAERSIADLLRMFRTEEILQGPYYLLMHGWIQIAGTSELALRAPSALGVAVAAGLTAMIGQRLYSPRVGLLAGILLAVTPTVTSLYAHDARPYGLVLMAACAASLAVILVTEAPRRSRWVVYGACVAMLGLGHALALTVLPSHALFVAQRAGKGTLARWGVVAGTGSLPGLALVLISQTKGSSPDWYAVPDVQQLVGSPGMVLGSAAFAWFLMGAAVTALGRRTEALLLACWLLVPPMVLYLSSQVFSPTFLPRYLLFCAPALMVLAARGITASRVTVVIGAILVVGLVWAPTSALRSEPSQREDYRAVAALIGGDQTDGDGILFDHPAHRKGIEYHLDPSERPVDLAFGASAAERGVLYAVEVRLTEVSLDGIERVWVVERPGHSRRQEVEDLLRGFEVLWREDASGLSLWLYARASPDDPD